MVESGLFPNGQKKTYFKVIPKPHNHFKKLETRVQALFQKCFENGIANPDSRPSADDWCRNLSHQRILQTSRPLPSAALVFPGYIYSKSILYNPSTSTAFPTIKYLNPLGLKGFKAIVANIFKKSPYQQLVDLIRDRERELKLKIEKRELFELELKAIVDNFHQKQVEVLTTEKLKIENLKNSFAPGVAHIDKAAKDLHIKEAEEIGMIYTELNKSLGDVETKIKQLYADLLGAKYEVHESEKMSIQKNLNDLLNLQQKEINDLINHPRKLTKYRISSNAPKIFRSYNADIITALSIRGFDTAADFIDISSEGLLKNRSGQWIKVSGIAQMRGKWLDDWRRKLDQHENILITDRIKNNYNSRILSLKEVLNKKEESFQKNIAELQSQYNNKKALAEDEKIKLHKQARDKIHLIKVKYDDLNSSLNSQIIQYRSSVETKLRDISFETEKELDTNLQSHASLFALNKQKIDNYLVEVKKEADELLSLQGELDLLPKKNFAL